MMRRCVILMMVSIAGFSCNLLSNEDSEKIEKTTDPKAMAYLASWHYESPALDDSIHQIPTEEIDWQAISSLNYFGLTFDEDGSLIPISDYQDMNGVEGSNFMGIYGPEVFLSHFSNGQQLLPKYR